MFFISHRENNVCQQINLHGFKLGKPMAVMSKGASSRS